ncbi:hypothetical protein ACFQE5_01690 [Pseudonocardia hispaniensis]|uniref:Uncharacterized protein n=1 Tax=Pseudonocardia hispaniensis TaxID=904933 RepID=A0ABW1IXF3_9PSEU
MFSAVSAGVGVLALAAALFLWWKRSAPKTMAVLFLTASAGVTGAIAGWLNNGAAWATRTTGLATAYLFGSPVPSLLLLFALAVFLWDLWPRHQAGRLTSVAAIAIPPLAQAAAAGAFGAAVLSALGFLSTAVGNGLSFMFGG